MIANNDVNESTRLSKFLSNDKELKIQSTNSGADTLKEYFYIHPNIFILYDNFKDIEYKEILDYLWLEKTRMTYQEHYQRLLGIKDKEVLNRKYPKLERTLK